MPRVQGLSIFVLIPLGGLGFARMISSPLSFCCWVTIDGIPPSTSPPLVSYLRLPGYRWQDTSASVKGTFWNTNWCTQSYQSAHRVGAYITGLKPEQSTSTDGRHPLCAQSSCIVVLLAPRCTARQQRMICKCCADCGAGVGRITKQLLLKHFHEVDLVEPSEHLLKTARKKLPHGDAAQGNKVANFFQLGLQSFSPEPARLVGLCVIVYARD